MADIPVLMFIVNFAFEAGWITEIEKLQITTKKTPQCKKLALEEILTNTHCDENASRLLCALRYINEMKLDPTPHTNELTTLYHSEVILSKLLAKGLVTEKEKVIYENLLLQESAKDNADENDKKENEVIVEDELQSEENTRGQIESSRNPMLICLVVKCVLQYLDLKNVKNLRLVSKLWSSVGLVILKARSRIEFFQTSDSYDTTVRSPLNFFSTFPVDTLETAPFTNYKFCGRDSAKHFNIEELNFFFQSQQKHIKKLDFDEVYLVDENWQPLTAYDISHWLLNSGLTKPNTKYKTKLQIYVSPKFVEGEDDSDFDKEASTNLCMLLDALLNIKHLLLTNCRVDIQDGIVISPSKMEIYVDYYKNGKRLSQIFVNDIIDISNSKQLHLGKDYDKNNETEIILEMDRNADGLDDVYLSNITLKNISKCTWTSNKLFICDIPFTEKSNLEVKRLSIVSSQLDISVLPKSIEKLSVYRIDQINCICSQPIVLQNIKAIKLQNNIESVLQFLLLRILVCPSLVELHLEHLDSLKEVNLTLIPQTLKTLVLRKIAIKDEDVNYKLNLDNLTLLDYAQNQLEAVCGSHIQTKTLVLGFLLSYNCNIDDFVNFLNNQNICNQCIYVGSLNWPKHSANGFEESLLRGYVDKESEYYIFENKVGKGIDSKEFYNVDRRHFF